MDLMAVIVAMKGDQVVRVSCKTCKKDRNYRPPRNQTEPGIAPAQKTSARSTSGSSSKKESKESVPLEAYHRKLLQENLGKPERPYLATELFKENDVLKHPLFGPGIVIKVIPPKKIEVVFERDIKTLICGGKRD